MDQLGTDLEFPDNCYLLGDLPKSRKRCYTGFGTANCSKARVSKEEMLKIQLVRSAIQDRGRS